MSGGPSGRHARCAARVPVGVLGHVIRLRLSEAANDEWGFAQS
jgi:hypothetical protein